MIVSPSVLATILGRSESLFHADMEANRSLISGAVDRARVLVIGAAGSIGSAFVHQLISFSPAVLHLVDPSENNLVEVVRSLRSAGGQLPNDFSTYAIAMGSREFEQFLKAASPYDVVVNFAALKHVRSERDPFTLMRLIDTNIFSFQDMLECLLPMPPSRVFSVSSDKAVNPENAMGASKAVMEDLLWFYAKHMHCTSARFANVAFSDGSLLHGFLRRLEKGQPLSAPEDVRRYFISHQEAGQLCLLACFLGNNRDLFVPRLEPALDLKTFADIACIFLESQGYRPRIFYSEEEARLFAQKRSVHDKEWPCYFSQSDTSGEKPFEEFFAADERVDFSRFQQLGVVSHCSLKQEDRLLEALAALRRIRDADVWIRQEMVAALQIAVPSLRHAEKEKNLDQKM